MKPRRNFNDTVFLFTLSAELKCLAQNQVLTRGQLARLLSVVVGIELSLTLNIQL